MKKITLFMTCILFSCSVSFGQYYYVSGGTGNPGNLNADNEYPLGSGLDASWTGILGPSITTPTWSPNQIIPFTFNFNGAPVTQYKVSSTGVLTFTTGTAAVPSTANTALPSVYIPDASICIWGVETSGTNDNIVTKTFGTAPNRQQWIFFTSHDLGGGWSYWSIVLEETSDKIYIVDQRHSGTSAGVTAGVQINGTTASSVLTSPSLQPLAGTDPTPLDNVYYEFIQGVQPAVDIELTSLTNLPYAASGNLNITGVLTNLGANTVTSLTINYNDGSGAIADNLTGLNILSGATYNFSHATPLTVIAGTNYALALDVAIATDANIANNTGNVSITGLTSLPTKTVVGEEKTGTWCGWCPRGAVGLANMESESDFIGIAIHNNDPMSVSSYDGAIGTYVPGGYPGGGIDRVADGDPSASSFLAMHNTRKTAVVPCTVNSITANYDAATSMVSVSTTAEFFGNITGDFRLSCVIIQDDMVSSAAGWTQSNYYSGGGSGPMAFPTGVNGAYDFSTGSDPASSSDFGGYDHVARSLSSNNILGDVGSLPATTVATGTYTHAFTDVNVTTMPGAANAAFVKEDAHAVVMIVDANTGEILNAAKASINGPVSVENINTADFNLQAFPNPTNEVSTISFNLAESAKVSMEVYNNVGSLVYAENAKTMTAGTQKITFNGTNLSGGIYFVNLKVGEQIITKKISLIK